ncbi:hypothetical protein TRIUR3_30054 [Triticum urartu]|uniref:Uncharacterized protein n=1 Tax=Triticum urartu TaxID=4572 RepID=M8AKH9_TRIUA|nr:hypothetical protein TRIUR3_30054 [Triticum urartu]
MARRLLALVVQLFGIGAPPSGAGDRHRPVYLRPTKWKPASPPPGLWSLIKRSVKSKVSPGHSSSVLASLLALCFLVPQSALHPIEPKNRFREMRTLVGVLRRMTQNGSKTDTMVYKIRVNPLLSAIVLCFQKGLCNRGDSSRFLHDEQIAVKGCGVYYAFQKEEVVI